jgi:hypothetical protein
MGRDIAVPGVELAINLLQELLADLKSKRIVSDGAVYVDAPFDPAKRIGRPPGSRNKSADPRGGGASWSGMTAEERSVEMKRRQAVAEAKRAAKRGETVKVKGMHPRDPNHPGHNQWIERLRASQKRAWASRGKKQQRVQLEKMRAGKASARAAINQLKAAS